EARAPQLAVFHGEAQRLDQVQARAGVGGQPDHVAGVGRNLRIDQDDVEHQVRTGSVGKVRATTQFTTRVAPAFLSTEAISFSVSPVVMTSSTTATLDPRSARVHWNAPRTLRRRSSKGRSICAGVSRARTQRSSSIFSGNSERAISTA